MALLQLGTLDQNRYIRSRNLIHLRIFLEEHGIPSIILGLELQSSTADYDAEAVESLYEVLRDLVLVEEEHLSKAWNIYALYAATYPDRAIQLNFNSFCADIPDDEQLNVASRVFEHPDGRVRQFLMQACDSNLESISDMRSSNALFRTCYMRKSCGLSYAYSTDFQYMERSYVLKCLTSAEDGNLALPSFILSPSTYPKERGTGSYFAFVNKKLSRKTAICDACGAYSGNTPDGIYISAKTEKVDLMFTADADTLVKCEDREAERFLYIYRARLPAMPRLHKTVYSLTTTDGKLVAPHLLHWRFDSPLKDGVEFPKVQPHGNSKKNKLPYKRADPDVVSEAMQILRNKSVTIMAAQQAIASLRGVVLKHSTLAHAAKKIRGRVGSRRTRNTATNPDAVRKLAERPGIKIKRFTRDHGTQEASMNLVILDKRLLKVAASCQPSLTDLQKRKAEVLNSLSTEVKYREFMEKRKKKPHDAAGYWRPQGGGWILDTTFGLSDYYITVLLAELSHIYSRTGKRLWVPVAVIAHKRKDAATLTEAFLHLSQMMASEIDGTKRCAAFLITDQEEALWELLQTKPFKNAVHGLCDFHLLCNFADSGFKPFKKRERGRKGQAVRVKKQRRSEPGEGSERTDPGEESERTDPGEESERTDPGATGESESDPDNFDETDHELTRKTKRRLDRHFRTTAVLYGRVDTLPHDVDEPNTQFTPGHIWSQTYDIFLKNMEEAYNEGLLDQGDYEFFLPRSRLIYEKNGPFFRLFIGKSTMFNTTNHIEGFFMRLKKVIGKRRRPLDQLYDDICVRMTEIFNDICLAVTAEGAGYAKLKEAADCALDFMEERELTLHLTKYGLPANFLGKDNFGTPLPEKLIEAVTQPGQRYKFVEKIEENWTAKEYDDTNLLIANHENRRETYQIEMRNNVLFCYEENCGGRCCVHIVITLALFPPEMDRVPFVDGCMAHYFNEEKRLRNAGRPGDGMKPNQIRKFAQKSHKNTNRPIAGRLPDCLSGDPEESTRSILNSTGGSSLNNTEVGVSFKMPSQSPASRSSSVSSVTSQRSVHSSFTDVQQPTRRSQRTAVKKKVFSF